MRKTITTKRSSSAKNTRKKTWYWYCTLHKESGTEGSHCGQCYGDFCDNFKHQPWIIIRK